MPRRLVHCCSFLPVLVVLCLLALLAGTFASAPEAVAQSSAPPHSSTADTTDRLLPQLIAESLETNLALQQQRTSLHQSRTVLAQARGQFLPSLSLQARYTRASGGRAIDFPVGDLLNPVYSTLNDILEQQGQDPRFSSIENQEIRFVREREQETKLQLRQVLFAPRVLYGFRARQHQVTAQEARVQAFRQELVRDVQVAYYNVRKAERRVEILRAARDLVRENRRTNQRLYEAGRVTQDAVFRAETEVLAVRQRIEEAKAGQAQALRYLNFLLNREADVPLPPMAEPVDAMLEREARDVLAAVGAADTVRTPAESRVLNARPEIDRLDAAADAAQDRSRVARSAFLPTVSLAVDAGIQGETYGFDDDKPFYQGSVVLQWNLFNGFQDRARVQERQLERQRLQTQREEVARQILLEVREAVDDVRVAQRSLQTAEARVRAARESFRLTERRYEEGRANQVTYTDARTALTEAQLNRNLTRFDLLTRLARLEYAAGLRTARGEQ